jgi:manganese/zinc/iron transport system permease protein
MSTGLPTGPLIIVSVSVIVGFSLLFATERGLVWEWWQRRLDQRRFAAATILIDLYRLGKRHHDPAYCAPEGMLVSVRGPIARVGLRQLAAQGVIQRSEKGWQLTPAGLEMAEKAALGRQMGSAISEETFFFAASPRLEAR